MKKSTGALITLAIIANSILWLMLKNQAGISAENGPMENFQIVCLALAFLLWLVATFVEKISTSKIILFSLALFNVSFLVLELDTRDFDAPFFNKLLNGKIRDAWLGCFWLILVISFFRKMKPAWAAFLNWLKTSSGVVMIVSGFFWLVSGLIDKSLLGRKELYREELMEVNATLLMLISALLFLLNRKKSTPQKSAN